MTTNHQTHADEASLRELTSEEAGHVSGARLDFKIGQLAFQIAGNGEWCIWDTNNLEDGPIGQG